MNDVIFRSATDDDLPVLAEIYIDAVDTLGPRAYSAGQVAAWRRWPNDNPEEFRRRLTAGFCRVAETAGRVVAFAEFTPPDHLDFLYTRGEFAGRGLASQLHHQLEEIARHRGAALLRTEASYLSRPVFKRLGYEVIEIEVVERFGETFRRFIMRKILRPEPPATSALSPCLSSHKCSFEQAPKVTAEEWVIYRESDAKNPGWFKGVTDAGIEGYFPLSWFELDTNASRATALRDYDARELTVEAGELLAVIERESGWVRVLNASEEIGWVPAACVGA
ncbi:MAG: hypothetical protein SynsKO_07310 [Synoicihabitans sp.]